MPSVYYVLNYQSQNCAFCIWCLLLNCIGNLLAYVAALFVTSVFSLVMCVGEWLVRETQNLLIAVGCRSNLDITKLVLIRGLLFFY